MTNVKVSATIYKAGADTNLHTYLSECDEFTEARVGLDFEITGECDCVEVLAVEDGVYESLADYNDVMVQEALSRYIESGSEDLSWSVQFCATASAWKGENGDFGYELSEFSNV